MKAFLIVALFFISRHSVTGQALDSTLRVNATRFKTERIFIHYDKSVYSPGETVWFKAYVLDGNKAAEITKSLYIDWIDLRGQVIFQTIAPILSGGVAYGQFDLPKNYEASLLHVCSYTKWMLNFDTGFLYRKAIPVVQNQPVQNQVQEPVATLNFYPEGGSMVMGLRSKVAFKSQNQWGTPVAISGVIEGDGVFIDSINIQHDGMGFLFIIPQENVTYTCRWWEKDGKEHLTTLPMAQSEGVTLQLASVNHASYFTLERSPGVSKAYETLHLVGTMYQEQVLKATIDLTKESTYSAILPTATLSSGILTVTIFDEAWNPIAERIMFVDNGNYRFPVQAIIRQKGIGKRSRNEIELVLPDSNLASLSVSVTDGELASDTSDQIVSYFMLSSELRGKIYNPSYYFKSNADSIARKLDLVMLTNGWRRFKWEDIARSKWPDLKFAKDTAYLTLSGHFSGVSGNQLQKEKMMTMMVRDKDSITQTVMAQIHPDGSFSTPGYSFFGDIQVYYQLPETFKRAEVEFMTSKLSHGNYPKVSATSLATPDTVGLNNQQRISKEMEAYAKMYGVKELENVTVTARKKSPVELLDQRYTKGFFEGWNARLFNVLDDPNSGSMSDIFKYLMGRVAGLRISETFSPTHTYSLNWRGGVPALYLDGFVSDVDELITVLPLNVALVKVFTPPFMGPRGSFGDPANGAIAVYTKKGEDALADIPGLPSAKAQGYSPIREFSSPDYAQAVTDDVADVRATLLWKPMISASKNENRFPLVFYNSDLYSKTLRIIVQGMTADGRFVYFQQLIK